MKYFIGYFRKCDILTMIGTTISLLGIYMAINNNINISVLCLMISGICDSFDGVLARSKSYSREMQEYGVELDSLSDAICFGLLPSIITIIISNSLICLIFCTFYMLSGIIRLAYFNMLHNTNKAQKGIYIGMPITVIAIVYPITYIIIKLINYELLKYSMPIILLVMGILEISKINVKKPNITKIIK